MSEVGDYWKPQLARADAKIERLSAIIADQKAEIERLRAALAIVGADHMLTGITTAKQKIMWATARAALGVDQQQMTEPK